MEMSSTVAGDFLMFCHLLCLTMTVFFHFVNVLHSQLTCQGKSMVMKCCLLPLDVMLLSRIRMLSTAQQMLQDSRSKIELIRLQIIKVTQAGSSSSGGGGSGAISDDDSDNHYSSTHRGQSPGP